MPSRGTSKLLAEQRPKTQEELEKEVERLKRRLEREKLAKTQAEDLLEQKAADLYERNQDLMALRDELEKLVAQRTAQMQKARDEALSALQIKSDFIANMSHELRTPMNGVLGILALLSDEDLSSKQRELLEIAQASGEHLLLVINDVLDFSKIEADKIELLMAPVHIRTYITSLCKPFQLQARQKNIQFKYEVDEKVPELLVSDKLRLTQIITNLLSNAIKFTHTGFVSLNVSCLHEDANGINTYRFCVSDTGIGISPENINAVFSAFEQADTSITREFGGTGLGMSITKRLVDMFEGEISVESQLGHGTRFFVDIKCKTTNESIGVDEIDIDCQKAIEKARILLVEDNKINQLVATKMLESWGVNVFLVEDGQAAIDVLQNDSFDLVLMDLQMPVKGGIEASKEIRSKGLISPQTPIVAMTAHSSKEHIDECFEAGMQAHISKPIDKTVLKNIIQEFTKIKANDNQDESTVNIPNTVHININEGLTRLNGDWNLLYNLIKNFIDEHTNIAEKLMQFDEQKEVISLLHRIKGSGGNLGMSQLSELASAYEQKLRDNIQLSDKEIEKLQMCMNAIENEFANVDKPHKISDVADSRKESKDYLLSTMNKILDNLKKDILASENGLKDLLQCHLPDSTQLLVEQASEAMQKFDVNSVAHAIALARETLD